MVDEALGGEAAPETPGESAPALAPSPAPEAAARPSGAGLEFLAGLPAVAATLRGAYDQVQGRAPYRWLSFGLLLWGLVDLYSQRRRLRSWKDGGQGIANSFGILRALVFTAGGLALWILALARSATLTRMPEWLLPALALGLALLYLGAALLAQRLVKGLRVSAQAWLLLSVLLMAAAAYYFGVPFAYAPALALATLSLLAAALAISGGVLAEARGLSLAVLLGAAGLALPLGIFSGQQAWGVEEQPLFSPTLLLPRMTRLLGNLSEDAARIRWAPRHTQSNQPGDAKFSDKLALSSWEGDQQGLLLYSRRPDDSSQVAWKPLGEEVSLGGFSPDGRFLAFTAAAPRSGTELQFLDTLPGARAAAGSSGEAAQAPPSLEANRYRKPAGSPLAILKVFGPSVQPLPAHGQVWRLGGRELYFAAPGGGAAWEAGSLYRVSLPGGSVRLIRGGRSFPAVAPGGERLLSVSPDPQTRYLSFSGQRVGAFLAGQGRLLPLEDRAGNRIIYLKAGSGRLVVSDTNGSRERAFVESPQYAGEWVSRNQDHEGEPVSLRWIDKGPHIRIHLSGPLGERERVVFRGPALSFSPPQWSRDGKRVAFLVREGERSSVVSMDPEGRDALRCFNTPDGLDELSFSPQGDRLAWICRRAGGSQEIWVAEADGKDPRRLHAGEGELSGLTWSGEGKHLAAQESFAWGLAGLRLVRPDLHRVLMVNLAEGRAKALTRYGLSSRGASFSPSGDAMAYFTDAHPWNWDPRPGRTRSASLVLSQLY